VKSAHLRYASYVARHKWFVFRAGLKTGAPIWRLLIHDWSKLSPAEWFPYVQKFYGLPIDVYRARRLGNPLTKAPLGHEFNSPGAFDRAWLHHQHRNPHHWQHWLLREDDGPIKALPIPEKFVREMVADWMGAGRAITGKWEVASWYAANRDKIVIHGDTRSLVERLIAAVAA
jgi:hypothetical protein